MNQRGTWLRVCAAAIFDPRMMEYMVDPAIADLQREPFSIARYLVAVKVFLVLVPRVCLQLGERYGAMTMRCSFCRRRDSEVEKLVAGPWRPLLGRVYICDRCAVRTIEIMNEQSGGVPQPRTDAFWRRVLSRVRWWLSHGVAICLHESGVIR